MGRCHDFGVQIQSGCGHPMEAREGSCVCPECSVVCEGQFKGCKAVWARGPRPIEVTRTTQAADRVASNGRPLGVEAIAVSYGLVPQAEGDGDPTLPARHEEQGNPVADNPSVSALHAELQAVSSAVFHQQAMLTQLLAVYSELRRPDNDLVAEQKERAEKLEAADEELRSSLEEVREALEASKRERAEVLAAAAEEMRDAKAFMQDLVSQLQGSLVELRMSWASERDAMAVALTSTVTEAMRSSEARLAERVEAAAAQVQGAVHERLRELEEGLAIATNALRGTEEMVAAQRTDTELIDAATTKLAASVADLESVLKIQHNELRDDLAAQHRVVTSLKKALRPVTESLPEHVALAIQTSEERTAQRIERALGKLRRTIESQPEPDAAEGVRRRSSVRPKRSVAVDTDSAPF